MLRNDSSLSHIFIILNGQSCSHLPSVGETLLAKTTLISGLICHLYVLLKTIDDLGSEIRK